MRHFPITCDNCAITQSETRGWIAGGEWTIGHVLPRIEIYTATDDTADPDRRLDWCSVDGLLAWLRVRILVR